jgi:lipopolysaccharide transport system ATP-binding protein
LPNYVDSQRHLDVRTSFKVKIEFWNMLDEANLNISLHLNSLTGECIFNIGTESKAFKKGIVTAECEIPNDFLNDGSYSISFMVVKDTASPLFNFEEALIFEIEDYREGMAWYGKWPGYIRPKIDFPIRQLEFDNFS